MATPSDSDVELKFSRDPDRAAFPSFCNSLVALEAPRAPSFPVLTDKAGPDGGLDGEWDLTGVDGFVPISIAAAGWNVYQYKTVDVATAGEQKALADLGRSVRGAINDLLSRQLTPKTLAKYVLFTNVRLGPESEVATTSGGVLNTQRAKIRNEIIKGTVANVDITIIDAGQIAGFIVRHPALRAGWFSPGQGTTWEEMQGRERRISGVNVPLIGRENEIANIQGWLIDPAVRVIAVSGPNSIGKTRLVIDATKPYALVTYFVEDVHTLIREGVRIYATGERSVVLVVEDPPVDVANRLAKQAAGCEKPIKLIITLPSPDHTPIVRLGDDAFIKPCHVARLTRDAAVKLVESVNSGLETRLRDWILQQAGGIPGILIDAAAIGDGLHRDSVSLRKQLSKKFRQSLEAKAGKEALPLVQALSPLVYVRIGGDSPELQILLSRIAPEIQVASALARLSRLVEFGFLRKQGEYVAVMPPMFAAGLFYDVVQVNTALPAQLIGDLDLAARKRLLERLATLELTDETPFSSILFSQTGPFGNSARFSENLEMLDYLARAIPYATARFLFQTLDSIWRDVVHRGQHGMRHLLSAVNELLDERETSATAFTILADLATREAAESNATEAANTFAECFVYWFPRSISYQEREAALEPMFASSDPALRLLGLKAVVTATNPPDTLSGRTMTALRIGSKPRFGTWQDCWDFLLRMVRRRISLCFDADEAIRAAALDNLPTTISRLSGHMQLEDAMQIVNEISEPFLRGALPLDPVELRNNVRWLRDFYERSGNAPGQKHWQEKWTRIKSDLDALLGRLETGSFDHRLRLALGRNSDYNEINFDGRKYFEYQVRIMQLARDACRSSDLVTEGTWEVLRSKEALNRIDFACFLGENDFLHQHFPELLRRAADGPFSKLLGFYLNGAAKLAPTWVDDVLEEMLNSPSSPKGALLAAIWAIGPTERNRLVLARLLDKRLVTVEEVANTFSTGNWLGRVSVKEVADVLEFILSEPGHEAAMGHVTSLFLHHKKPLPRELFDVVRPVFNAPIGSSARDTYDYDQIATGLARTDLKAGFELLRETVQRISGEGGLGWWTGWNPFDDYGSRDFWEYLRSQAPEDAYRALGEWSIESRTPERGQFAGERHLLDLETHQEILITLARTHLNAARIFAKCAHSAQTGFFPFAYRMVELHSKDSGVIGGLNSALIQTAGFGYEYDWHTSAIQTVQAELEGLNLSAVAREWLESLRELLLRRRSESRRDFGSSEPSFLD